MKNHSKKLKELLVALSKDAKIKKALGSLKSEEAGSHKFTSMKVLFIQILRLSSRLIGKRQARVIEDVLDAVGILISLSLVLKENLFDRPEVKAFFEKNWSELKRTSSKIYKTSAEFVDRNLRKLKKSKQKPESLQLP